MIESRNITLTLDKAKEWYNSGNEALKEAALQAFTEYEIKDKPYAMIKTLEGACNVLGLDIDKVNDYITQFSLIEDGLGSHIAAIFKLDIICKALNRGWDNSLTDGTIFYPYVHIYPLEPKTYEIAKGGDLEVCDTLIISNREYLLLGGDFNADSDLKGLGDFEGGVGIATPILGLFGCKSKAVARHLSTYFAKEIFEACYAHHVELYETV